MLNKSQETLKYIPTRVKSNMPERNDKSIKLLNSNKRPNERPNDNKKKTFSIYIMI